MQVAQLLREAAAATLEVEVGNDMDAAMALLDGSADYYLGTCHTGAGASLGVLVGVLGSQRCHTFGRSVVSAAELRDVVEGGAVAFGFSIDQIDHLVPLFARVLAERAS